jgi:hypothetical protein
VAAAVQVGHDRLDAPVAVPVEDVTGVPGGEQLRVESCVLRPRQRMGTHPHLGFRVPSGIDAVRSVGR